MARALDGIGKSSSRDVHDHMSLESLTYRRKNG
jgi:hypothetical protein